MAEESEGQVIEVRYQGIHTARAYYECSRYNESKERRMYENKKGVVPKGLEVDPTMFKTKTGFAVGALIILGITAALYTLFW